MQFRFKRQKIIKDEDESESEDEVLEDLNLKYFGFESQETDPNPNMFVLKTREGKSHGGLLG